MLPGSRTRLIFTLTGLLFLHGCNGGNTRGENEPADASDTAAGPAQTLPTVTVAPTPLIRSETPAPAHRVLDVGLVTFDPGLPEDENRGRELGIFPEVRRAEASFLPYAMREVLVDSQQWGAVRVLPDADASTELLVQGKILHSDGARLVLEIRATDPSGRIWQHQVYSALSAEPVSTVNQGTVINERPFDNLYHRIANDLVQARRSLADKQLQELRELGFLRYAAALAPEAFSGYLQPTLEGGYGYSRLPSSSDPMVQRIKKVRGQEYVFIDTMDDQYFELYSAMAPTYQLWRQYNREQVLYQEEKEQRIKERKAPRRGYLAMKDSYNRYRWAKLQQDELMELAQGFENEVAPTAVELEGNVVQLNGSLEQRYRDWRRILRDIYELEVGASPAGTR